MRDTGLGCLVSIAVFFGLIVFVGWVAAPILGELEPYKEDRAKLAEAKAIIQQDLIAQSHVDAEESAYERENIKRERKADKVRSFALSEAPEMWRVLQEVRSERCILTNGLEVLDTALTVFGRDVSQDPGHRRVAEHIAELDRLESALGNKLEDAYLKHTAILATPDKDELALLYQQALEQGVQEAESVESKFLLLKERK